MGWNGGNGDEIVGIGMRTIHGNGVGQFIFPCHSPDLGLDSDLKL